MKHKQYLSLVRHSEAFRTMEPFVQKKVLGARGKSMNGYAAIFLDERNLIYAAKKEMVEKNERVLKDLGLEMQKFRKDYLDTQETLEQKDGMDNAEDLLKSL